jgi:hypothetical protein
MMAAADMSRTSIPPAKWSLTRVMLASAVAFFIAALVAIGREVVKLEDI